MENGKANLQVNVGRRARLASVAICMGFAFVVGTAVFGETNAVVRVNDATAANVLPALLRPVTLRDDAGNAESGFVDPFRRRGEDGDGAAAGPGEEGLMRTTMGEISSEFRILAITIPQDTNTPRAALIQFYNADEPILVHEGDLVRVDRLGAHGRGRTGRAARPRAPAVGKSVRPRTAADGRGGVPGVRRGTADVELEEQLRKFVFYVNVKNIEPTFIEVYHNKKRPDETIRLNW